METMCYYGQTDSFNNGYRKAYWILYLAQDGQAEAYTRQIQDIQHDTCTSYNGHPYDGIGKPYGPYIRHRTIKLDLIPDKRQPPWASNQL